jgi:autotransporter-associated beta strand protein
LTKAGAGTLNLVSSNTFTGTLYVDTSATSGSDGIVRITKSAVTATMASPINIRNNNSASSTLQIDGASGSIVITNEFRINCRNNSVPAIQSVSGNNTLSGPIFIDVGGATMPFQSDAGLLTFSGEQKYVGALTGGRTFTFLGAGNFLVSGAILNSDNEAPISLAKGGAGTLTLSAANTYGNMTTVSNGVLLLTGSITSTGTVAVVGGTLAGTGTINDIVSVQSGAVLAPGAGNGSVGTLTINNNLTLAGTVSVDLNKSLGTFDRVVGVNQLTYGGALVVTNLAGTLNVGDSFAIFSAVAPSGNFTSVTGSAGSGKGFSFNPTTGILSVVQTIPPTPTNITFSVSGSNLTLSWPESYKGWILQSQTNSLAVGIDTNSASWFDVSGSESVNTTNISINTANPTVFYRLRNP